ncbi:RICIN domain-containing protein [Lentzea sp. NPDC004782]|uniref:RICIN domain-containing protein n=1 Tax=Lentzea sp. NPDC004782 TaxID=3154458 RepID=UPI0033A6DA32
MQLRRLWPALTAIVAVSVLAVPAAQADPAALDFTTTWVNHNSGKCLEIADSYTYDGARAQQWTCDSSVLTQHWYMHGVGAAWELRNSNSGKCLEIADSYTYDGARAQQWTCDGSATQQWYWVQWGGEPGYRLINKNSGKCLEIADSYTYDGARAQQWRCDGGVGTQQWH